MLAARSAVGLTLVGEDGVMLEGCSFDRSRTIVCREIAQQSLTTVVKHTGLGSSPEWWGSHYVSGARYLERE
jgi:hypothetical protein